MFFENSEVVVVIWHGKNIFWTKSALKGHGESQNMKHSLENK